jgi:hypothetical protein
MAYRIKEVNVNFFYNENIGCENQLKSTARFLNQMQFAKLAQQKTGRWTAYSDANGRLVIAKLLRLGIFRAVD